MTLRTVLNKHQQLLVTQVLVNIWRIGTGSSADLHPSNLQWTDAEDLFVDGVVVDCGPDTAEEQARLYGPWGWIDLLDFGDQLAMLALFWDSIDRIQIETGYGTLRQYHLQIVGRFGGLALPPAVIGLGAPPIDQVHPLMAWDEAARQLEHRPSDD
jgi:hypothetical protein